MDVLFTTTSSAKLNSIPVVNGQIIALNDKLGYYYDMGSIRRRINQIEFVDSDPPSGKGLSEILYVNSKTFKSYIWSDSIAGYEQLGADVQVVKTGKGNAVTDITFNSGILTVTQGAIFAENNELQKHLNDTNNPHHVTAADLNLGNVSNTADKDKSVNSAARLTIARSIDGLMFDGSKNISSYSICTTAGDQAVKVVTVKSEISSVFDLQLVVKFKYDNAADSPKLKVNNLQEYPIFYEDTAVPRNFLKAGHVYQFVFTGDSYDIVGDINTDTVNSYDVFSGSNPGLVPEATRADIDKYLKSDGTWSSPSYDVPNYDIMRGSTDNRNGEAGMVPMPTLGDANRYLSVRGTWDIIDATDEYTFEMTTDSTSWRDLGTFMNTLANQLSDANCKKLTVHIRGDANNQNGSSSVLISARLTTFQSLTLDFENLRIHPTGTPKTFLEIRDIGKNSTTDLTIKNLNLSKADSQIVSEVVLSSASDNNDLLNLTFENCNLPIYSDKAIVKLDQVSTLRIHRCIFEDYGETGTYSSQPVVEVNSGYVEISHSVVNAKSRLVELVPSESSDLMVDIHDNLLSNSGQFRHIFNNALNSSSELISSEIGLESLSWSTIQKLTLEDPDKMLGLINGSTKFIDMQQSVRGYSYQHWYLEAQLVDVDISKRQSIFLLRWPIVSGAVPASQAQGPYPTSMLHDNVLPNLLKLLPEDLKAVIVPYDVVTNTDSSGPVTTKDLLWVPSRGQLWGTSTVENSQLAYFRGVPMPFQGTPYFCLPYDTSKNANIIIRTGKEDTVAYMNGSGNYQEISTSAAKSSNLPLYLVFGFAIGNSQ